jgi:hypothetical protein
MPGQVGVAGLCMGFEGGGPGGMESNLEGQCQKTPRVEVVGPVVCRPGVGCQPPAGGGVEIVR